MMQCLANALSLDGTLHRAEQKKRLTLLIVSFMGMLLPVVGMLMLIDRWSSRPPFSVSTLAYSCVFLGSLMTAVVIISKRHLTTCVVVPGLYTVAAGFLMWDLNARTHGQTNWALLVLIIDVLLVVEVPERYSTGLVCFVVVWLLVLGCEESFRFGLFEMPGLVWQEGAEGRRAILSKLTACDALPCPVGFPPYTLLPSISIFAVDFIATRGFARSALKEKEAMQRTIATVQDIASLLAGYDVEGVARMLEAQETLLPEEMRATLQTLEENLRKYRPYLPAALFEEDEVDGVQHTSVAPPGLESGTATIVFTDIRASTSIWECAPDGMGAALHTHNRVMREVMQVFGGYEVKTIGDAFMIAFATTADGINFALQVHEKLLHADWPASLLNVPICTPQDSLWGGLTVRIGVNTGPVAIEQNALTGRTDYFGHTVNVASRLESICTPGAVAVSSDLWTSDCCACSAVVGETESLDLKGVSDTIFVCPVWPVTLGRRKGRPLGDLRVFHKGSLVSKATGSTHSTSSLQSVVVPSSARQVSGTVGVMDLAVRDERHATLNDINAGLSTLTVALSQSGGSLVTLLGSRVCVSWNVSRPAPAHMENAIRFAQRMVVKATLHGVGLASGLIQHGDVGARKQRFVTVMGTTVRRSWTLCEEAVRDGVVCLFEPPEGTTLLSAVEKVLVPYKECYRVVTKCGSRESVY